MRPATSLISALALGSLGFWALPVGAADEVHCVSLHEAVIAPGLSIQPSSGTATIRGGTMECHGPVNGHTPTGIGGYEEDFRYGTKDPDTCQQGGEGEGVWRAFVPTNAGEQRLDAPFTLTYGDLTSNPGSVTAEFQGEGVHGTASVTPVEGDCVVEPITRVRVKAEFYFAQSFFRR
jgi:hypothetical protein